MSRQRSPVRGAWLTFFQVAERRWLTIASLLFSLVLASAPSLAAPSGRSAFGQVKKRSHLERYGFGRHTRRSRLPLYQRERIERRWNTVLRHRRLVRGLKRRPVGAQRQKIILRRTLCLESSTIGAANVGHGTHLRAATTYGTQHKQMRRNRRLKLTGGRKARALSTAPRAVSEPKKARQPRDLRQRHGSKRWRRYRPANRRPTPTKRRDRKAGKKAGRWKVWK